MTRSLILISTNSSMSPRACIPLPPPLPLCPSSLPLLRSPHTSLYPPFLPPSGPITGSSRVRALASHSIFAALSACQRACSELHYPFHWIQQIGDAYHSSPNRT